MDVRKAVVARYSAGAREKQEALCCPVTYDSELLRSLPQEILDKDYGCGNPTRYVREGDTVLDLGSGGGKICYMAAQLVGCNGRVIGVDMNDDMLALARKYQPEMARELGFDRISFYKARIQDLALDLEAVDRYLTQHPIGDAVALGVFEDWQAEARANSPLVADESIDVVISNCVLNLVEDRFKRDMMVDLFRILKPGGRLAISDIVADDVIPQHLKSDPDLWSGCISGAFQELEIIRELESAGFLSIKIEEWAEQPWRVIEDLEFRSVTLTAVKGAGGTCLDKGQAVIYRGPYRSVTDDEGHEFPRGERMAICERSYQLLTEGSCAADFIGIEPGVKKEPVPWCAPKGTRRPATETKGARHQRADACCDTDCC